MEAKPIIELVKKVAKEHDMKMLKTSRSFKEFIKRKLDIEVRDLCYKHGVVGSNVLDYMNYARKIMARTLREVYPHSLEISMEEYIQLIDKITQLTRNLHTKRIPLDPKIMARVEKLTKKMLLSLDKLVREYERTVDGRQN